MLTVQEALTELKKCRITDSEQIVRRWLREGVLKGIRTESKKTGWFIPEDELERFIKEKNLTKPEGIFGY